jgi:hypothetical protein
MNALHRHDLMSNSCVNKEIEKFNRKLHFRFERLGNVEMIEAVNNRNLYTRHGQHLNTEGKENMAKKIVSAIERVLSKQVEPIIGKWYTDKATDILDHQPAQGTIDNNNEMEINECSNTPGGLDNLKIQDTKITSDTIDRKSPERPRRQPVTRNSDLVMDKHQQVLTRGDRNSRNNIVTMKPNLSILHQNIQSIGNKLTEIDLVLKSDLKDIDVLCFTEHWLKEDDLKLIHIDQYELASYFSRKQHNRVGSCIYVGKNIRTQNLNCFQNISAEKDFGVSATELVDYDYIIACIYRSPDGNF